MSCEANHVPTIIIRQNSGTVYQRSACEVTKLSDLLKTLKEFQDCSNNVLTDLVTRFENSGSDKSDNEKAEGDEGDHEEYGKKKKLVHIS